jgi:hypothetical protein
MDGGDGYPQGTFCIARDGIGTGPVISGPAQSANAGVLAEALLRISNWDEQSIRPNARCV